MVAHMIYVVGSFGRQKRATEEGTKHGRRQRARQVKSLAKTKDEVQLHTTPGPCTDITTIDYEHLYSVDSRLVTHNGHGLVLHFPQTVLVINNDTRW